MGKVIIHFVERAKEVHFNFHTWPSRVSASSDCAGPGMSDTANQHQITIKPRPQLVRGNLILFCGMLALLVCLLTAGSLWSGTRPASIADAIIIFLALMYGGFLVNQITCYARIDHEKISRIGPFGSWHLPLVQITSALIIGGGTRGVPGLIVRTAKKHISFQQLAFSRKDLERIQSELKDACAQLGVVLQTEHTPLNIPVNTIVKYGWFYLLGICAFVGFMVLRYLNR